MRTSSPYPRLFFLAAGSLCATMLAAQTPIAPSAQPAPTHHARPTAARAAAAVPVESPPPTPMPNWPINDQPSPASVHFDSAGLHIDAANSSLQQILTAVSSATGTKVEGFAKDERVYGNFGPGQPREVLAQLLQGSGYNIVMIGDQGSGAPREIELSSRSAARGSQPNGNGNQPQSDNDDDSNDNQVDYQPPPPAPPQQPPAGRQGFGGSDGNGPQRTPQQIQQELMQRQQQMLQQQQQQMQTTNPPPNQ